MKEIIIDGIDVSECKYLNKVVNEEPYCNIDEEHLYTCSSDENCYYKQLKRLEQENEELKNRLKTLDEEDFVYEVTEIEYNNFKKMNNYKQVLEEIRVICKCSKESSCDECPICGDCEELCVNDDNLQNIILDKINEVLGVEE